MDFTFTLDNTRWSMYKLEQAEYCAGSPTEIEIVYGHRNLEKEKEEIIARRETQMKKEEKKKIQRHKRLDEYEFREIMITNNSIFSDFRTEADEEVHTKPDILVIE